MPMQYLSDEWLSEADEALAALEPVGEPVVIGFHVTGGPDGTSDHRLVLGPDRVGAERGTGGAALVFSLGWDLAVAIAQGETSAQRAFLDGLLQLSGNPSLLLGYQRQLADIDDRLATLRQQTEFT